VLYPGAFQQVFLSSDYFVIPLGISCSFFNISGQPYVITTPPAPTPVPTPAPTPAPTPQLTSSPIPQVYCNNSIGIGYCIADNTIFINQTLVNINTIDISNNKIIANGYNQTAGSTLKLCISNSESGILNITGNATIDGTIILCLSAAFNQTTKILIIDAGCLSGNVTIMLSKDYSSSNCDKVIVSSIQTGTQLYALITPSMNCGSSTNGIVIGVVLGVFALLVLVGLILAAVYYQKLKRILYKNEIVVEEGIQRGKALTTINRQ